MIARNKEAVCMVPGCTRPVGTSRAICKQCYGTAKLMVNANEATWEEMEGFNLCLPAKSRMRSPIRTALAVAREHQPALTKPRKTARKTKA